MTNKPTKERLIQTATDVFFERGFKGTSIREIGDRMGISSSIIYHYFKNKESILLEIVKVFSDDVLKILTGINLRISDDLECFRAMLKKHILLISTQYKKESKIVIWELDTLRGKDFRPLQSGRQIFDIYTERIINLQKKGLVNDIDPRIIVQALNGILIRYVLSGQDSSRFSPAEVRESYERLIMEGIFKK